MICSIYLFFVFIPRIKDFAKIRLLVYVSFKPICNPVIWLIKLIRKCSVYCFLPIFCYVYLINRCPTKALQNQTPIIAWSRRKQSLRHLKVFGYICYSQVPKEKKHKLDETSEKCIFTGYSSQSKGYRLYSLKSNKIVISHGVLFDEKATWN